MGTGRFWMTTNLKKRDIGNDALASPKRQQVANTYTIQLRDKALALQKEQKTTLPYIKKNTTSAWAQYSVRVKNRDSLIQKPATSNHLSLLKKS